MKTLRCRCYLQCNCRPCWSTGLDPILSRMSLTSTAEVTPEARPGPGQGMNTSRCRATPPSYSGTLILYSVHSYCTVYTLILYSVLSYCAVYSHTVNPRHIQRGGRAHPVQATGQGRRGRDRGSAPQRDRPCLGGGHRGREETTQVYQGKDIFYRGGQ